MMREAGGGRGIAGGARNPIRRCAPKKAACGIGGAPGASRQRGLPLPARLPCTSLHLPGMPRAPPGASPPAGRPRHAPSLAASPPRPCHSRRSGAYVAPPGETASRTPKSTGGPRGASPHGALPNTKGTPAPEGAAAPCPFCGGLGLPRKPGIDRLSGSSVSVGVASLHLVVDSRGEEYYKCNGCNMSFVFADREIETMLPGMMADLSVAFRIKHYYGDGVSAHDLLTRHRTATVRKVRGRLSFFASRIAQNEIIVCFNYNGIRTFGSFRRRRGANGYYYTFEGLDRV